MFRKIFLAIFLSLFVSLSAAEFDAPKDAKCGNCGMFVAKYPNWVTMIKHGGENVYFDGVKCMFKYMFKNGFTDEAYVLDYYNLEQIPAKDAFYVTGSDVLGPMGHELIPFASKPEAKTFMKDHHGSEILVYDDINEDLVKSLKK